MKMQFLISVSCLLAVCFAGALATEECHFNQYINSKLVSDYSAVLLTIDSLADCLSYLKNNKQTHKVVAFDAETRRCCSVLQTLSYEVQKEYGWTTFEIREEHHGNQTTHRPSEQSTQRSTAATSGRPGNSTEVTTGICNNTGNSIHYIDGKRQFSVYAYDFNVCEDFYSARDYVNFMNCTTTIVDHNYPNLKVELIVNAEPEYDYVRLENYNYRGIFTGEPYRKYERVIRGNTLDVGWTTDYTGTRKLGFCLTVSGTYDQPSSNDSSSVSTNSYRSSSEASQTTARPGNSTEITTGVCDDGSDYYFDGTRHFSVFSYDFNVCDNVNASYFYYNNMRCNKTIISYAYPNLKVELLVNTETSFDYVRLTNLIFDRTFTATGRAKYELVIPGNRLQILWHTDSSANYPLGFCLTVTGTYAQPTSAPTPSTDLPDLTNSTTAWSIRKLFGWA